MRIKFCTSDLLYWQAVLAVVIGQFALCYGAMTCRGYPPMTEGELIRLLASPLFVWVPAVFGSRVNRLRGIIVMSLSLTVFLAMVYVNGEIVPSVGSHAGPVGIIGTYFVQIAFLTIIVAPAAFSTLYFFERVAGDVWRMIWCRRTEQQTFTETWNRALCRTSPTIPAQPCR